MKQKETDYKEENVCNYCENNSCSKHPTHADTDGQGLGKSGELHQARSEAVGGEWSIGLHEASNKECFDYDIGWIAVGILIAMITHRLWCGAI